MTQVQLAKLIGVSERSMQGYEMGEVIPWKKMERLSVVLEKDLFWLNHGRQQGEVTGLEPLLEAVSRLTEEVSEIRKLLQSRGL